jgi:hypothetical protein
LLVRLFGPLPEVLRCREESADGGRGRAGQLPEVLQIFVEFSVG